MQKKKAGSWHHGDLRRVIMDESLKVVEKNGVDALSLRDLAQRLGVSSGAPYHHFPSRIALLAALAQEGFENLNREMVARRDAAAHNPTARLGALGMGYVHFALENPGYFRILFLPIKSAAGGKSESYQALREASGLAFQLLESAVKNCLEAGLAPPYRQEDLVLFAWASVHGLATLWIEGPLRGQSGMPDRHRIEAEIAQWAARLFAAAAPQGKRIKRKAPHPP